MSLAIILGDPHIGKNTSQGKTGLGSNLNSRVSDQIDLLDWTLDQADELGVKDIIITGDVFEEPKPHPALITIFVSWLKKCQVYDVNVHIIIGNHDVLRSGYVYNSPLDIISEIELNNVHVYKDIDTILIGSSALTLLPFRDRKSFFCDSNKDALSLLKESITYELASIPVTYKKILIGHLAIEGSIPIGDEIDDIANELFCTVDMFTGYDYVWMGHVHKPQVMKKELPYIAHIGSMDLSNFSENDHNKHIVVLDLDSNDNNCFDLVKLPTRNLKKISITIPKAVDDTTRYVIDEIEKLNENFNKSIVKVEILLNDPDLKSVNKSSIEKFLNKQGSFHITSVSESKKISLIKRDNKNTIDTKMDLKSAIKTYADLYIEDKKKEKFIALAMEVVKNFKIEAKD